MKQQNFKTKHRTQKHSKILGFFYMTKN